MVLFQHRSFAAHAPLLCEVNSMRLNRNSWHYKVWARSFDDWDNVPASTDLCRYCHRVFWQLVAYAIIGCLALIAAGMCVWMVYLLIWKALIPHLGPALLFIGGVVVVIAAIAMYVRWLYGKRPNKEPKTLAGHYLRASKDKVCPLVEFGDEE